MSGVAVNDLRKGWSNDSFSSRRQRCRLSVRRSSKESVLCVCLVRKGSLIAAIVARHVKLSSRQHALCPMELGSVIKWASRSKDLSIR
jgi:hypothetical protein